MGALYLESLREISVFCLGMGLDVTSNQNQVEYLHKIFKAKNVPVLQEH